MDKQVRNYLLTLLTLVSLSCSGCLSPEPPEATPPAIDFTDQLGRVVRLEKVPERIVSLDPADTEILFALGLGGRVVAVTDESDYPPDAQTKPRVGGPYTTTVETVMAFSPDLVLATSFYQEKLIPQLEEKTVPVFALEPKTIDGVLEAITLVGDITREQGAASKLVAEMRGRIKAVTDRVDTVHGGKRPRVFYLIWHSPIWTAGSGTLENDLIETAGGVNIVQDIAGYGAISLDEVAQANPEVMIATFRLSLGINADLSYRFLLTEETLARTDARQYGRVINLWDIPLTRPGPRIIDALEELGIALYLEPQDSPENHNYRIRPVPVQFALPTDRPGDTDF